MVLSMHTIEENWDNPDVRKDYYLSGVVAFLFLIFTIIIFLH